MTDTAKRLAGPSAGTGSEATIYTVPALTTAVLKSIRIVNSDSSAQACKASIGADATGTRILPASFTVPANSTYEDTCWIVMAAAETLRWNGNANLTITVSGVEIS